MEAEGKGTSDWVREMLGGETKRFYSFEDGRKYQYSPTAAGYQVIPDDLRILPAPILPRDSGASTEITSATHLFDLKDGVAYLRVDTDLISDGKGLTDAFQSALEKVEANFEGLVISKLENLTSAGLSIPKLAERIRGGDFDAIEESLESMIELHGELQSFSKPIVFATFGRVQGAEALIALTSQRICAAAESWIGFEETAIGLLPVGGGCMEMMRRAFMPLNKSSTLEPLPILRQLFEVIGYGKISNSALEAREFGYLSERDDIVNNRDFVLRRAKDKVISLCAEGVKTSVVEKSVYVTGERGKAALGASTYLLQESGFASAHEKCVADKLAHVLSGGNLTSPQWVDENYILDLEKEAFLSLCGEEKTLARLDHYAKTGKRLKN
jgi:3-hydroxyacyl-CoA dehydrogenase